MAEKYGKSQQELNELDLAALVEELENAKQDALDSRFKLATGQLTDTSRIGKIRKQIARISLVIRRREIEAAEAAITTKASRK
ncbi:MAG: 50S ribosomal protein L29 [Actinomycetota bacterium]|nr:50S ribosomal protein L29 [Actinomycetota bacterium]MBM3815624.1 50S ribosomal protein L29 [Actinomycetota bacterium]